MVAAKGTPAGTAADVLATRKSNRGSSAVTQFGLTLIDHRGVDSTEAVAAEPINAQRAVSRPAWPTNEEPQCGVTPGSVEGDQLGRRGDSRTTDCANNSFDRSPAETVRSLGLATRPLSPTGVVFPKTAVNLRRTGGCDLPKIRIRFRTPLARFFSLGLYSFPILSRKGRTDAYLSV